ncbi:hypothetical protein C4578_00260 [Candidatus Microgenomates bacterium]|jgi:hypothetical protein|nr:MAG: hypothetical protein C4578_00260 [Candidatus Microgenomates bacterium]
MAKTEKSINTKLLSSKIKNLQLLSAQSLNSKHPHAVKFLTEAGVNPGKIREHATKLLTSGAIAGSLLLSSPQVGLIPDSKPSSAIVQTKENISKSLANQLSQILPEKIGPLNADQETKVSHLLFDIFGITAVPKLGSTHLNQTYGLIGAEQHLPRYPGDTIDQHDEYQKSGITPGLGAWGYFAKSKRDLTKEDVLKEKYYVAVQTLYLPDWNIRTRFLYEWYKHRKVVVVNPVNGKAVVAVVGDAGPAEWTGKHFGGSPEIMAYLNLNVGKQKGPVVLFFVDDPENKVQLGPLEYNLGEEK